MSVLKAVLQASKTEKGKCHQYFEEATDTPLFSYYMDQALWVILKIQLIGFY